MLFRDKWNKWCSTMRKAAKNVDYKMKCKEGKTLMIFPFGFRSCVLLRTKVGAVVDTGGADIWNSGKFNCNKTPCNMLLGWSWYKVYIFVSTLLTQNIQYMPSLITFVVIARSTVHRIKSKLCKIRLHWSGFFKKNPKQLSFFKKFINLCPVNQEKQDSNIPE